MKNLFELIEDYDGFKKGTIMQKGSDVTEDGIEWFDVTTEIETGERHAEGNIPGECYSTYNIPENLLIPAKEIDVQKVNEFFNNGIKY